MAIAPPDYQTTEAWSVRPEPPPPAVWETGWAVDVILVTQEAALEAISLEKADAQRERVVQATEALATSLEDLGAVYAPLFRLGAEASDLPRALESYIETDNRGRAFIIVTDSALPAALSEVILRDSLVHDRFAGVLWLGPADRLGFDTLFQPPLTPSEICSRRYEPQTPCIEAISLGRGQEGVSISGGETESRILTDYISWLETNATRLAEPFGLLEDIEIVDIRSPGQTDEE